MDFSVLTWIFVGIGSAVFVILTWLPVGGLSVWLWNNASPYHILFGIEPSPAEQDAVWLGYVLFAIAYVPAWLGLSGAWIIVKIVQKTVGTLKLSHKLAKKLSGW